jgi:predicted transcriptional regulator/DNA-binding XRE family transcriptional regulator
MADTKVFAGPRLRRIRTDLGLSQSRMAADIGISPSYLNLIERNQRPLTVQVLLKLSATYHIDVAGLQGDGEAGGAEALREVFADPLLAGELPAPSELIEVADLAPNVSRAVVRLHEAYRESLERLSDLSQSLARQGEDEIDTMARLPVDRVARYFETHGPWFDDLEDAATAIAERLTPRDDIYSALKDHLRQACGVDVRVLPIHAMADARARFDRHSMRLFLSEQLPLDQRAILVALQIALLGSFDLLAKLTDATGMKDAEAARLCRLAFARRLAEAILAPAPRLAAAAEDLRYDIVRLARRFAMPASQIMHRLAALGAGDNNLPEAFLADLDASGSILTRIAGAGFVFPRFGALCGRLPVFDHNPIGRVTSASVEFADGTAFLVTAFADEGLAPEGDGPPPRRLTLLGMARKDATGSVYDPSESAAPRPIGVSCRLCERAACTHRAHPAATRPAAFYDHVVGLSEYELA